MKHFAQAKPYNEFDLHLKEENCADLNFERDVDECSLFLEENILGVLIPGLQQLIKLYENEEPVSEQEVAFQTVSSTIYSDIDPLNYLAMFLLRNNPKHSSEINQHPYFKLLQTHLAAIRGEVERRRSTLGMTQDQIKEEIKIKASQVLGKSSSVTKE